MALNTSRQLYQESRKCSHLFKKYKSGKCQSYKNRTELHQELPTIDAKCITSGACTFCVWFLLLSFRRTAVLFSPNLQFPWTFFLWCLKSVAPCRPFYWNIARVCFPFNYRNTFIYFICLFIYLFILNL